MSGHSREGAGRAGAGPWLGNLSGQIAIAGGVLSLVLALVVIFSVAGRYFFSKPIEGDFEIVKMATAVSVFSFLPYAQWRRSNIMVDTFTNWLPQMAQRRIDAFWDLVYAVFMTLVAVQLARGALDSVRSGETMMQLPILIWPAIAICSVLSLLVTLVAFVTCVQMWGRR